MGREARRRSIFCFSEQVSRRSRCNDAPSSKENAITHIEETRTRVPKNDGIYTIQLIENESRLDLVR
jgi:hypothetical protein